MKSVVLSQIVQFLSQTSSTDKARFEREIRRVIRRPYFGKLQKAPLEKIRLYQFRHKDEVYQIHYQTRPGTIILITLERRHHIIDWVDPTYALVHTPRLSVK